MFWENGNLKKFLILQETELSELEKWKEPTLKMFLILWGKKCSSSKLKKAPVFLGEPISAFHHCFLSCFHFTTDFYYYFWVFSLLIAFVNFINFRVFHHCLGGFILLLIFTIVFRVFSFYKLSFPWLVFCVDVPWVLWIGESIFLLSGIFFLTLLPNIWHNLLLSRLFCKQTVLPRRLQGLPLSFETQTWSICLFESYSV